MIYDIFSRTAPAMPKPGKGTEIVKLLLSQVSKGMQEPILPMTLPALAAHYQHLLHMYLAQNSSIRTTNTMNCVARWGT